MCRIRRIARGGLTMVTVDGNTVFAASADNIVRVWEKVNPETRNPEPETRNPKPETRNPEPETSSLLLAS